MGASSVSEMTERDPDPTIEDVPDSNEVDDTDHNDDVAEPRNDKVEDADA